MIPNFFVDNCFERIFDRIRYIIEFVNVIVCGILNSKIDFTMQ